MAARRGKDDDRIFAIAIDGKRFELHRGAVNRRSEIDLFNATGQTLQSLINAIAGGVEAPFMVAGLIFLARRSNGERVTYDEVADEITYGTEIDWTGGTGTPAPEAPGVS